MQRNATECKLSDMICAFGGVQSILYHKHVVMRCDVMDRHSAAIGDMALAIQTLLLLFESGSVGWMGSNAWLHGPFRERKSGLRHPK